MLLGLVWLLLRPLAVLDESARRVADGQYGERLAVRGGDELAGLARDMNAMAAAVQRRVEQLEQVAAEVELSLRPVMAQSDLRLECGCAELTVDMDRELFKSLLYNLLDNARKASERGGRILLTAREVEGRAEILVQDYGRGIPPEELDKVCQPFYMVDKSRSRKAGGAGLGLALCREIVSVHGGIMEMGSRPGKGTLVTLRFPLSAKREGDADCGAR